MKTRYLIITVCICLANIVYSRSMAQDRLSTSIKQRMIEMNMNDTKEEKKYLKLLSEIPKESTISDQCVVELYQMYHLTDTELSKYLTTLRNDGSWSDINYLDTKRSGWEVKDHAERTLALCKEYYLRKKAGRKTDVLVKAIHSAMNYWFNHRFRCTNWWYNEIGIPRTFGPAFLLFENEMSADEKQKAIEVMASSRFGRTGQNKIWQAGNVLMRALLQNDDKLMRTARDTICSEILTDKPEGIKPDWSFHQHGPQQQFGNYGLSYLCNLSFYANLFTGTPLAFPATQQDILVSLLLEGFQWITWKGYWDVNALNRQLFHNANIHKVFSLIFAAHNLKQACKPEQRRAIETFIIRNTSGNVVNDFCGTKHFEYSDYTIHRTKNWMASLRMASERVIGVEQVNEDNLQGYYMADGALYTYCRGDEYHNIYPLWNWRMIPGTTTYQSTTPIPNPNKTDARNHSLLVGGISNGNIGVSAMQLNRNKLRANKTWVFTADAVFCMGGNIQTDSIGVDTLITCIDQRLYKQGLWTNGKNKFHHDNTGYIVLDGDTCVLQTIEKKGLWSDVMGLYSMDDIEKGKLFSLHIEHQLKRITQPSTYQYVILPNATSKQTQNFPTDAFTVLQNNGSCQSLVYRNRCYVVVYNPSELTLPNGKKRFFQVPGLYITMEDGDIITFQPWRSS